MKAGLFVIMAFLAVEPAVPQDAQPAIDSTVVVSGETWEKQRNAERTAAEARRLFGELRDGSGDRALACRTAAQAERDYDDAIQEARQLAEASKPGAKARLEERVKAMKDRSDNLDDLQDRACKAGGVKPRQGQGQGGQRGRFP